MLLNHNIGWLEISVDQISLDYRSESPDNLVEETQSPFFSIYLVRCPPSHYFTTRGK
jgi:hypothetical protein